MTRMLDPDRTWAIVDAASVEDLAHKLSRQVFSLCTGFRLNGYLVLNNSESEDGPQEYALVHECDLELKTTHLVWMDTPERAEAYLRIALDRRTVAARRIQSVAEHGRCPHCV